MSYAVTNIPNKRENPFDYNNHVSPREKKIERIKELTERRNSFTKHYLMSDGTYQAEVSFTPRHYQDHNGKWQDISNRIVASNEQGFAFRNEANAFDVHFANNFNANFLVKFKLKDSKHIAWRLENSSGVNGVKADETVIYPEILPNTDLEYISFAEGLKERIILKELNTPEIFHLRFMAVGLEPMKDQNGTMVLKDSQTGEEKLIIPSPFMVDQNNKISPNVIMDIAPTQNPNQFELTIRPDQAWLSEPNRAFPVIIDPTVKNTGAYVTDIDTDTYVSSGSDVKHYNHPYMTTGYDATLGYTRALVRFTLPSIPSGSIVTNAKFRAYKYTQTSRTSEDLIVSRITEPWDKTILTWTNKPSIDLNNDETQSALTSVAGNHIGWVDFNVWSIVKGWYNGGLANHGLMMMHNQESNPLFFYYTREHGSSVPNLQISYMTDLIGLNPYWSYANTDIGSVNTFNGNFLSSVVDFALPGRGISTTVSRTYNSRGSLDGIFGQKWFSNLDMQLRDLDGGTFGVQGKVLLDSTGTERPFIYTSDGNRFIAPSNYPVQLYKQTDGSGNTVFVLQEAYATPGTTTPQHEFNTKLPSMTFNNNGKLIKAKDGKGNTTHISWDAQSVAIADPSGRIVTLNRDATGKVQTLTDHNDVAKVTYVYDGDYLSQIIYDNASYADPVIEYEWESGLLRSLTDRNGTPNYLTYDAKNRIMSIGKVNMLANPSLEAGSEGYIDAWAKTIIYDYGNITRDIAVSKTGKASAHIQSSSTVHPDATTSYLYLSQKVPVKPATDYTLSSFVKTDDLKGVAVLNSRQYKNDGNPTGNWLGSWYTTMTGTNDWTELVLTVTTEPDAAYLEVYLEIQHDNTQFGGDAYFDQVQLVEGSTTKPFHGHSEFGGYGTFAGSQTTWVTSPLGEVVRYQTNNYGNPSEVTLDPNGINVTTSFTWNLSDQLEGLTSPLGNTYIYQYDALGNMTEVKDPKDRTTAYDYYYNRLKQVTMADNESIQNSWDPVNLNKLTQENQALNSKGFIYEDGNLLEESNILGVADNRIDNSSFTNFDASFQPSNWIGSRPAGSTNRVEYDSTAPFGGGYVLHLNSGVNHSDYQSTQDYIALTGIDDFIVSAYIRCMSTTGNKAHIQVHWYDNAQGLIYYDDAIVVVSTDWKRFFRRITPPGNAAYARISAIVYNGVDAYFDNVQFEKSDYVRDYNYLENTSFERGNAKWVSSDNHSSVIPDPASYSGGYTAKITREATGSSYLETENSFPVNAGNERSRPGLCPAVKIQPIAMTALSSCVR